MNWTKVKVILIILFALINVMLAGVLYSKNSDDSHFSKQTLDEVKTILKNNNIEVPDKFISSETEIMSIPEATPIMSYESSFIKGIQGAAELNEKGDFIIGNTAVSVYEDVVHFENSEEGTAENTGGEEAKLAAEKYFSDFGIDISAGFESAVRNGDEFTLKYVQKYNGFDIFGASGEVTVRGGAVSSANIVWYEISDKHIQSAKTVSPAEALLDFAADKTRGEKGCAVAAVVRGYTAQSDSGASVRNTQLIPSVKITTDIGSEFFYDIRNPE